MKKLLCLLAAFVICFGMTATAFAAEGEFVPSITYKGSPDARNATMEGDNVDACIVVTSIGEAQNKNTDITQDDRDLLLDVYDDLSSGAASLPVEDDYVIRDLVDVSFENEDCITDSTHGNKGEKLKQEGVTLSVDFDLGIGQYVDVMVLAYVDGEWSPIKSVTNNGDGTVTCVFEDICPVVFAVQQDQYVDNPQTGDAMGQDLLLWGGLFAVSMVALVAAVFVYAKNRKRA